MEGQARRRRDDPFQWSFWHSKRIRNQRTVLLVRPYTSVATLMSARSLFTIPAPISHWLPICSLRDGQMVVAPFGKNEGLVRPWGRSTVQRPLGSVSRHGRSIFRQEATASLLFPRLGEINSRCLRVFATGGISPFMDRWPFDRVLLLISAGTLRDK